MRGENSQCIRKKCRAFGLSLEKICWGTDYPGFEMPESLLAKMKNVNNHADGLGIMPVSDKHMEGILGGNYLNFIKRTGQVD